MKQEQINNVVKGHMQTFVVFDNFEIQLLFYSCQFDCTIGNLIPVQYFELFKILTKALACRMWPSESQAKKQVLLSSSEDNVLALFSSKSFSKCVCVLNIVRKCIKGEKKIGLVCVG